MKIQIGNWGPIGKCELDLQKSLSIIYGDNNIGKSYAMQVVYLFLKKMLVYTSKPLVYYAGYKRYYQDDYRILQMISELSMTKMCGKRTLQICYWNSTQEGWRRNGFQNGLTHWKIRLERFLP